MIFKSYYKDPQLSKTRYTQPQIFIKTQNWMEYLNHAQNSAQRFINYKHKFSCDVCKPCCGQSRSG